VYALLVVTAGWPVLLAGACGVVAAMASNAVLNRRSVAERPSGWAEVAMHHGVQASLSRLAERVGADRAVVLPASAEQVSGVPEGIPAHVAATRRPVLLTEGASYRAQRRTNIDSESLMLLPVVDDERTVALVLCQRRAPRGFDDAALEVATGAVEELIPLLNPAAQSGRPSRSPRRSVRPAPRPVR